MGIVRLRRKLRDISGDPLELSSRPFGQGKGGSGNKQPWMWETGRLNPLGFVQNGRAFSTWMFASGKLDPDGKVDNSKTFDNWMWSAGTLDPGGSVVNSRSLN